MRIRRRGAAAPPHQRAAVAAMEGGDVAGGGPAADGVGDTPAATRPSEDSECVGWQVRVFWPRMKKWYKGTISDYDPCRGTFDAELGQNCGAWRAPPLCPPPFLPFVVLAIRCGEHAATRTPATIMHPLCPSLGFRRRVAVQAPRLRGDGVLPVSAD